MLKQPVGQKRHTNIAIVSHEAKVEGKKYHFEIACYKNKMVDLRSGAEKDLSQVLQSESVFNSVDRGELSTSKDLLAVFGTGNHAQVCREILALGSFRVGEKERDSGLDQLLLEVSNAASLMVMGSDGGPLTAAQIHSTLEEIGFRVKPCPTRKRPEEHAKLLAREAVKMLENRMSGKILRINMRLKLLIQDRSIKDRSGILVMSEDPEALIIVAHPSMYKVLRDEFGEQSVILLDSDCRIALPVYERVASPKKDEVVTEHIAAPAPSLPTGPLCQSCGGVGFPSTEELRAHFKSQWHAFNKKRAVKQMGPLDQLEFETLPHSLKVGFQAVDDY